MTISVLHALGWMLVLLDGWVIHSHWLVGVGFCLLFYTFFKIGADDGNAKK